MWLFENKENLEKEKEKEKEKENEKLVPPFKVGERFKYLGVEMICYRHHKYPWKFPVILANYVDLTGVIQDAYFLPGEWITLLEEQRR